jgi:hypothetical protein
MQTSPQYEADHCEPAGEELDPGIEGLTERFGPLLGLNAVAGGSVLNYPKVLEMDAATVLNKLRLEGARSAYQQRYHQLIHQKGSEACPTSN